MPERLWEFAPSARPMPALLRAAHVKDMVIKWPRWIFLRGCHLLRYAFLMALTAITQVCWYSLALLAEGVIDLGAAGSRMAPVIIL